MKRLLTCLILAGVTAATSLQAGEQPAKAACCSTEAKASCSADKATAAKSCCSSSSAKVARKNVTVKGATLLVQR
ncbi:MAG: hypothetical protein U1G07_26825 [Verrucomicrobiota bacterium]